MKRFFQQGAGFSLWCVGVLLSTVVMIGVILWLFYAVLRMLVAGS